LPSTPATKGELTLGRSTALTSTFTTPKSDFAPLLQTVRAAGLLRSRRLTYAAAIGLDLLALTVIWAAVYVVGHSWWVLFLAPPAAVFTTRAMYIGHDVGHRQVAHTARVNHLLGLLVGDLIAGVGARWWIDKHNRHHANPNVVGRDPDVDPGAVIWNAVQVADRRSPFGQWLARNQGRFYLLLICGEALNLTVTSIREARRGRDRVLLAVHTVGYIAALLFMLGPVRALAFALIHQALVGLHLGCSFAPNHKGMPMPDPDARQVDFLRKQVLCSRNVVGSRVTDWWLGGLNYQIEHHLFPSMPRSNLRHARPLVQAHCHALGVPYTEETFVVSMRHAFDYLHNVGGAAPG
jgi:fatty acid desaturase